MISTFSEHHFTHSVADNMGLSSLDYNCCLPNLRKHAKFRKQLNI